jgi:hypothetical protein
MAGVQDWQTAHDALRAAAVLLGLPPPPPIFPVGPQVAGGPSLPLLQPHVVAGAAAAAAPAGAAGGAPAGLPALGAVGPIDRSVHGVGLAAAQGSAAPATTTSFEEDPNLLAIFNLMRSAPPRLPMEAEGGRFAVDTNGNVLVVLKARDGESFIKEKPEKEDPRWLKVTGFQGLLGYSAAGRKVKALFDTLLRSVRFLDRF